MVRLQTIIMSEVEVDRIARKIIAKRLADYGFERLTVRDEVDFDGEHFTHN